MRRKLLSTVTVFLLIMTTICLEGENDTKYFETIKKIVNMDLVVKGTQIEMMGNKYTLQDGKFVGEENSETYAFFIDFREVIV